MGDEMGVDPVELRDPQKRKMEHKGLGIAGN